MGFLRRSRAVPVHLRLQVSWWTSAGLVCFMLVVAMVAHMMTGVDGLWEAHADEADVRFLEGESYPDDLIIEARGDPRYSGARNKYWVFIHIILIGYMFLGLNTVCDIYFTGALEVMVDKWDIKPDVAGATFMAAGGSAPELFSSLIGACYLSNDVGFSTIVGSAVFNVLFVIGLCGAVVSAPIELTWWPLFRDCTYYIFGLILLAIFAYTGNEIVLGEAIVLFLGYLLYCTIMYFNANIENFVKTLSCRVKNDDGTPTKHSQVAPSPGSSLRDAGATDAPPGPPEHHKGAADPVVVAGPVHSQSKSKLLIPPVAAASAPQGQPQKSPRGSHIRVNHFSVHHSPRSSPKTSPREDKYTNQMTNQITDKVVVNDLEAKGDSLATGKVDDVEDADKESKDEAMKGDGFKTSAPGDAAEEAEAGDSNAEDDVEELVIMPEEMIPRIIWFIKLPIYGSLYWLTPKPTESKFLLTFFVSLLWIGGYAYFLIWWVDLIVGMISLDINLAGITVLAAGTSIPDLVSSMAVAKAGEGDMAVSSSIGSNVFDILVGLPFPWMIKILFVELDPGYVIPIVSPYIVVYVIILLFMVLCVVISIHFLGWKLNKCLGLCMALLYGLFMIMALYLEIGKPDWAKI